MQNTIKKYQSCPGAGHTRGFLILEALIAMGVMLMIVPSAVSLVFSGQAMQISVQKKLDSMSDSADIISNGASEQAADSSLRYSQEFGKSTCTAGSSAVFSNTKIYANDPSEAPSAGIDFGQNASATDVIARNGFIYETVDSPVQSNPDFYIINSLDPQSPVLVSSINTGPGLAGVAVAGHYAYVANRSSVSELQVIDLQDRKAPVVVAKFRLSPPTATTTAPRAASIVYENGTIFLGTEKWAGDEFNVIDVREPLSPQYAGGFDADTLVHAAYVDSYDQKYAYIADADADQMRVLDVSDPAHMDFLSGFSPAGSEVLEGMTVDSPPAPASGSVSTDNFLYFGRAGGGFDNPGQYELFEFDISLDPLAAAPIRVLNVPGGVYGIVPTPAYIFLAVGDSSVQVWKSDLSSMIYRIILPSKPVSLSCDHDRLYVGLSGRQGFGIIIPG